MITIIHYRDGGVLVKGINPNRSAVHEMLYAAGDWPARYPAPSIYCLTLMSNKTDPRSDDVASFGMLLDLAAKAIEQREYLKAIS